MSDERLQQEATRWQDAVDALLAQAEEEDAQDEATYGAEGRGEELPRDLTFRTRRLQKIREANATLEQAARNAGAANPGEPPGRVRTAPATESSPEVPASGSYRIYGSIHGDINHCTLCHSRVYAPSLLRRSSFGYEGRERYDAQARMRESRKELDSGSSPE